MAAPPPPMGGPGPPTKGAAPAKDRSQLLKDLSKGDGASKGLKKVQTNDRSSPILKEEKGGGGGGGPFGAIPMRLPGGGGPRPGGGAPRPGGPPRPAPGGAPRTALGGGGPPPGGAPRPAPAVGGGPPRPAPAVGGGPPRPAPAVGGGPPRPAPGGPPRPVHVARMPMQPPSVAPAATSSGGIGKCRSVYPFDPVESGDLGFAVGDLITILSKDGEWWEGELNGQRGSFPYNYVEEILGEVSSGGSGNDGGGGVETCTALYMFAQNQDGDLSFNKGDVITVISKDGQWWQGSLNGTTGSFPANYVQLNSGDSSAAAPSRAPPPSRVSNGPPAGGPPTGAPRRPAPGPTPGPPSVAPVARPSPPTGGPPRIAPVSSPSPMRAPPPSTPPAPTGGGGGPPPAPSGGGGPPAPPGGAGLPPPPTGGPPPPIGGAKKIGGGDAGAGRGALLNSIEGFSKGGLKKSNTVDKSAPVLKTEKAPPAGAAGGVGGLFAGGMPGLRPRGGGAAAPARTPSGPPAGGAAPTGAPRRPAPGPTPGPPTGGAPPRVARIPPPTVARAPPPTPAPAPAGPIATALYTYEASQEGDLSFAEGEKITITSQSGNWWEGINAAGTKGVFPSNYVQLD